MRGRRVHDARDGSRLLRPPRRPRVSQAARVSTERSGGLRRRAGDLQRGRRRVSLAACDRRRSASPPARARTVLRRPDGRIGVRRRCRAAPRGLAACRGRPRAVLRGHVRRASRRDGDSPRHRASLDADRTGPRGDGRRLVAGRHRGAVLRGTRDRGHCLDHFTQAPWRSPRSTCRSSPAPPSSAGA